MSPLALLAPYCKSLDPSGEARCWKRGRFVGGRCPDCWDLLLGSNDPEVMADLASEEDIPEGALADLANTRWAPVGVEIARRPGPIPAGVMSRLATHPEAMVRMEAAKRDDLTTENADEMLRASSHDVGVRRAIAGYAPLSAWASESLLNDEDLDVHAALAKNPTAGIDDLEMLATAHPVNDVRSSAQENLSGRGHPVT